MSANLVSELLRRRVPQVVGVYLAAGWGLLEFTDWATGRFALSKGARARRPERPPTDDQTASS